ncbi:hypothetical protein JQ615_10805 [Bradyrhizobium jicamae]|uniref:GcrA cell cycle regulator n=2 Tax=Bradyrhizobium jicamae TaxID=280332 RepID=A0ABS5FGH4_9BRAD|nr:GcrA family cell cycle regulator [Bradyrhizobium jicamae]MBR0795880.1 hypothetical protein [Bradyrhizobium jicamae]MBR0935565.1 hypothetical protein [Bradyrhizobium jicamae]
MEAMNWPPEHSAVLRELRARGMSYTAIADTINARFNTAYTRNAALGRAQRMGLGALERPEPSLPGYLDPPRPSLMPEPLGAGRLREVRVDPRTDLLRGPDIFTGRVEMPVLRCAEVAPRHLSLLELDCGDCRYPYGGDADGESITFCGHPRRPGSRYCTPHFHLTRDLRSSAKPVLSDAWLAAIGLA